MNAADPDAVAQTLPDAWAAMQSIRAEVAFASLYAAPLARLDLTGPAAAIATTLGLLSDDYAGVAARATTLDPMLKAVATGDFTDVMPQTAMDEAIVAGFAQKIPPEVFVDLLKDKKLGEALLRVLPVFDAGVAGDARSVTDALLVLRRAGLDDTARRATLQLLLLDRAT